MKQSRCCLGSKCSYSFKFWPILSIYIYVLYEYWRTLPEDDPQEKVETCRGPSVLVKNFML